MKKTESDKSMHAVYAAVHAPEFAAQAMLRLRHSLRSQPVAVLDGQPPLERVCAANTLGRREGITDGMTRVDAESFGGLVLLRRSLREEAEARAALLDCAGKYTPAIEDASTGTAASCVLDLSGTEKLFGPPLALATGLARELEGFGMQASIAVSANFHAAVALARSGCGVTQVAMCGEQQALAPLLLSVLPLSGEQEETLSMWGIRTLGGLAALPERALVARMGQAGKRLRALARGEQAHLFTPREQAFVLSESYEFDSPVTVLESLLFALSPMVEQLLLRARDRALALASLRVTLQLEGGGEHVRAIRPALPTADRKLLIKLLQLDLDAHPPAAAVVSITATAEPGSESKVQLGLFSPQLPEPSRMDVTLARLRALVGEGHVGSPQLKDSHAGDSFHVCEFTTLRKGSGMPEFTFAPSVRRVRPPARLAVRLAGTVPTGFRYGEQQYTVIQAFGPWRSSGEWWASSMWCCERWDLVSDMAGCASVLQIGDPKLLCVRVARDLLQQQWLLEAIYD